MIYGVPTSLGNLHVNTLHNVEVLWPARWFTPSLRLHELASLVKNRRIGSKEPGSRFTQRPFDFLLFLVATSCSESWGRFWMSIYNPLFFRRLGCFSNSNSQAKALTLPRNTHQSRFHSPGTGSCSITACFACPLEERWNTFEGAYLEAKERLAVDFWTLARTQVDLRQDSVRSCNIPRKPHASAARIRAEKSPFTWPKCRALLKRHLSLKTD